MLGSHGGVGIGVANAVLELDCALVFVTALTGLSSTLSGWAGQFASGDSSANEAPLAVSVERTVHSGDFVFAANLPVAS